MDRFRGRARRVLPLEGRDRVEDAEQAHLVREVHEAAARRHARQRAVVGEAREQIAAATLFFPFFLQLFGRLVRVM